MRERNCIRSSLRRLLAAIAACLWAMLAAFSVGTIISAASLAMKGLLSVSLGVEIVRARVCLAKVVEGPTGCLMVRFRFCMGARLVMSMSLGRP